MPSNLPIDKTKSFNPPQANFNYPEALQDRVHEEVGKSKAGRSGKSRLKS